MAKVWSAPPQPDLPSGTFPAVQPGALRPGPLPSAMLSPLCVYCGAAKGKRREYADAARAFGRVMARRGVGLVYGGGSVGLMGVVADALIEAGAGDSIVGVITRELLDKELGHRGIRDLRIVDSMHQRKKAMADIARGFVALPGGVGTLDELFEIITWAQLAIHDCPIGVLNVKVDGKGFYDDLIRFLDHCAAEEFLRIDPRRALVVDDDPDRLLDRMSTQPAVERFGWKRT
ncbi:MAG: TIGR00730 family Rossman fold protein [Phycisphaeraceae bacterium]|nr:TIGR00730 family Rossman fold protein [Phycisphaeraceae bacterium]